MSEQRERPQFRPVPQRKTLGEWAKYIHDWAVSKGWWEPKDYDIDGNPKPRNRYEILALIHSEVSEALEHLRNKNRNPATGAEVPLYSYWITPEGKPDGWSIEMIDIIVRCLDALASEGADVDFLMEVKTGYNNGRERRHGGKDA
jgi:hypothetical protein